MNIKDLYKLSEVAELLMVDVQTVRKYVRSGKIKAIKINERVIRIPKSEIEYLLPVSKGENK